jgi:hypothetical protein
MFLLSCNRQHVPGTLRRRRGPARGPGTCVPLLALTERGNSVLLCRCRRSSHTTGPSTPNITTDISSNALDCHRAVTIDAEQGAQASLTGPLISHSPLPNERRGRLDTFGSGGTSSIPEPPVPNPTAATFLCERRLLDPNTRARHRETARPDVSGPGVIGSLWSKTFSRPATMWLAARRVTQRLTGLGERCTMTRRRSNAHQPRSAQRPNAPRF